jgi:hypothetical protein
VRWGAPSGTSLRGTCIDGQVLAGALHIFSKGRMQDDTLLERAEDHADRIGAAVAPRSTRRRFSVPGGTARVRVAGTIGPMHDGAEPGAFHFVINLTVRCITG